MDALVAVLYDMIEDERQLRLFRDYVGQCLWEANHAIYGIGGVTYSQKQYVELAHPDEGKSSKMTAEEIKQHVLELLR